MWAGFSLRSQFWHPVSPFYVLSDRIGSGSAQEHPEDEPRKVVKTIKGMNLGVRCWLHSLVSDCDLGPVALPVCVSFLTFNIGMIVMLPVVVMKIRYNDFEVLEW